MSHSPVLARIKSSLLTVSLSDSDDIVIRPTFGRTKYENLGYEVKIAKRIPLFEDSVRFGGAEPRAQRNYCLGGEGAWATADGVTRSLQEK